MKHLTLFIVLASVFTLLYISEVKNAEPIDLVAGRSFVENNLGKAFVFAANETNQTCTPIGSYPDWPWWYPSKCCPNAYGEKAMGVPPYWYGKCIDKRNPAAQLGPGYCDLNIQWGGGWWFLAHGTVLNNQTCCNGTMVPGNGC